MRTIGFVLTFFARAAYLSVLIVSNASILSVDTQAIFEYRILGLELISMLS